MLFAEAPVPSYCLWKKSNEYPVISSTVDSSVPAPAAFSTHGLKSKTLYNGYVPLGCGAFGSTFVAEYVGIST